MFRFINFTAGNGSPVFYPSPLRVVGTTPCGGGPVFAALALRSNGVAIRRIREKQAQPAVSSRSGSATDGRKQARLVDDFSWTSISVVLSLLLGTANSRSERGD
jgi:hypothetical protein